MSKDSKNKKETINYPNGDIYEGETLNGKKHGQGKMTYAEGNEFNRKVYNGEWKDGKEHGQGKMTYAVWDWYHRKVYNGEWKDGKEHGHGKMTYAVGDFYHRKEYNGDWKDGKEHGHGVMKYVDGTVFDGEFKDDYPNGYGTYKFANGDVCEGEWKDGKQNGHGIYKYADGDAEEGEYDDGKLNGHGVYKWADGTVFDGEWKDGKRNGHGVMKYADGRVYEGEWKDGKQNGHGVLKLADGDVYDGEWKDGLPNGHGTLTLADGKKQECEWKDGKFLGTKVEDKKEVVKEDNNNIEVVTITTKKETIKYPNGDVYEGETLNGKKHGQGKMKYKNGDVYDGEWKDDKYNGHGVLKWYHGNVYDGEWKDGKRNGHGIMKWPGGVVFEGEWKDGERNGHGVEKWDDGSVFDVGWKDDKANGHGVMKWADDTIQEGEWKEGKFLETKEEVKVEGIKDVLNNNSISTSSNERPYKKSISSVEFGLYPQTQVSDSMLTSKLNARVGLLPIPSNSYLWTSYGYYIRGSSFNYMWYIDIEEGDSKYRGVYFTQYRPICIEWTSCSNSSCQHDNGYNTNTVYWFKYEPIKWTIVEEANGYATLVCDMVIDSQEYYSSGSFESHNHNGGKGYSNNYALSSIRKWLNETFYNTAFNELQKSIIQITEVDNSLASTEDEENDYVCENTQDKVYLLSCKEVEKYYESATSREKKIGDYAKSQGYWSHKSSYSKWNCHWWLRSPSVESGNCANYSCDNGFIEFNFVDYTDYGVVPALKIKL